MSFVAPSAVVEHQRQVWHLESGEFHREREGNGNVGWNFTTEIRGDMVPRYVEIRTGRCRSIELVYRQVLMHFWCTSLLFGKKRDDYKL